MAIYRITVFFGQSNMGWSESYYYDSSTLDTLASAINILLQTRVDLLTTIHEIDGVRISIEGDHRRSKLATAGPNEISPGVFLNIPAKGTYPGGSQAIKYDQVRACMQIILAKTGVNLARRYFDGVPDELTATENDSLNTGNPPVWWAKWKEFIRLWKARGFSIKCLDKTGDNPERQIIRWVLRDTAPNVLGAMLNSAFALTVGVGDNIFIRGVKNKYSGIRSPNGKWVVDQVTVDDIGGTTTYWLRNATAFDPNIIKVLGFARKAKYVYTIPDVIETSRAGIHKRGKRFGTPVGRTPVIRYANS